MTGVNTALAPSRATAHKPKQGGRHTAIHILVNLGLIQPTSQEL